MPKLLHLDSSPLYGRSISRQLTHTFVEQWKRSHTGSTVVERDLNATNLPPITAAWIGAAYTPEAARTPEQHDVLKLSDELIAELQDADELVVGVPMHNFGIPSVLKLWIDQITRVEKTFSYADGTPRGLVSARRATFVIATGGIYDAGTQLASFNFVEPYLRSLFGFLGVIDILFLTAGGTMSLNYGGDRDAFIAPHAQAAEQLAGAGA